MGATQVVDIRIYRLRPGSRETFHRLVHEDCVPLVMEWGHDVLAYGPSELDADCYFMIRAYPTIEKMHADQDAFYSSDTWRQGPREAIVELIEESSEVVFTLSTEAVDAMKAGSTVSPVSGILR